MSKCPYCGQLNSRDFTQCIDCRRELPWAQEVRDKHAAEVARFEAEAAAMGPGILDEDFKWEPSPTSTTPDYPAHYESGKMHHCPECGHTNSLAMTHCTACGELLPWADRAQEERNREILEAKQQVAIQESHDQMWDQINQARAAQKPLSASFYYVTFTIAAVVFGLMVLWASRP